MFVRVNLISDFNFRLVKFFFLRIRLVEVLKGEGMCKYTSGPTFQKLHSRSYQGRVPQCRHPTYNLFKLQGSELFVLQKHSHQPIFHGL